MSSRIILDSNAYSHLSRGDERILELLDGAERVYVPVTVLGELLSGFRNGSREQRNRRQLRSFLNTPRVRSLHTTEGVADIYSEILTNLRILRRPIPTNDIWIAAHTVDSGAMLVTYDRHFEVIEGLLRWPL